MATTVARHDTLFIAKSGVQFLFGEEEFPVEEGFRKKLNIRCCDVDIFVALVSISARGISFLRRPRRNDRNLVIVDNVGFHGFIHRLPW